jgi:hypothetical protein
MDDEKAEDDEAAGTGDKNVLKPMFDKSKHGWPE